MSIVADDVNEIMNEMCLTKAKKNLLKFMCIKKNSLGERCLKDERFFLNNCFKYKFSSSEIYCWVNQLNIWRAAVSDIWLFPPIYAV